MFPSGIPLSSAPLSSSGDVDYSSPDPNIALRSHAGEICHLFKAQPWDIFAGETVDVFASSHGYQWGDDWTLVCESWQHWPAVIESPGSWSTSIYQGGQWRSGATSYGQMVFLNLDGSLDHWKDYNWRGRWYRTWAAPWSMDGWYGGRRPEAFAIFQTGYIDDIQWDDQRIYISCRDARRALEVVLNSRTYLGLNAAIQLGTNAKISVTDWAAINSNELSFEMFFQQGAAANGTLMSYGWDSGKTSDGWRVVVTSDGAVVFEYPADDILIISDSGIIEPNEPYRVSLTFSEITRLWVNGNIVGSHAAQISIPAVVVGSTPFQIGK